MTDVIDNYSTAQITDALHCHYKKWVRTHYLPEYSKRELFEVLIKRARQINTNIDDLVKTSPVWGDNFFER